MKPPWVKQFISVIIMIVISIGISLLLRHFFFGGAGNDDDSNNNNGPPNIFGPQDNNNALRTFAKDKHEIDSACSRTTLVKDKGTWCKEACIPEYFHCCDPFDEFVLYNYTVPITQSSTAISTNTIASTTNDVDDVKLTSDRYNAPKEKNLTFLEGYENDQTCTFDANVRGCMAYAKCHALAGQIDPAPYNLPELCSMERLKEDNDSCTELCSKLECCFSEESDNCLAKKFDLCMGYAPCQNLRVINDPTDVLETAPRTLDYD